jgi:hypothetical protein
MKHTVIEYLPYLMSFLSYLMMHLVGNKNTLGWVLGLMNQSLWFTWVIVSEQWGFLPMVLMFTFAYIRNYLKWKKDDFEKTLIQITPLSK